MRENLYSFRLLGREYLRIWYRYNFRSPEGRAARTKVLSYFIAALFLLFLLALIARGYGYPWTGFGPGGPQSDLPRHQKTLWDWMDLLLVPVLLAVVAFIFTRAQKNREIALSTLERGGEALENYLDYMTRLLVDQDIRDDELVERASRAARARTVAVLDLLNPTQKGHLLRFLAEAGLIQGHTPFVSMNRADLRSLDLDPGVYTECNLHGANLDRASLVHCSFTNSDLASTTIQSANLESADFSGCNMDYALLSRSDLYRARLIEAHLIKADLQDANLEDADLRSAILRTANFKGANLSRANLREAYLVFADFRLANLRGADLSRSDLTQSNFYGADLRGADLSGADLSGAFVSARQLRKAKSIDGAWLPAGRWP
jgi:uncharacterized protein YjbI with pentapeptide repeats